MSMVVFLRVWVLSTLDLTLYSISSVACVCLVDLLPFWSLKPPPVPVPFPASFPGVDLIVLTLVFIRLCCSHWRFHFGSCPRVRARRPAQFSSAVFVGAESATLLHFWSGQVRAQSFISRSGVIERNQFSRAVYSALAFAARVLDLLPSSLSWFLLSSPIRPRSAPCFPLGTSLRARECSLSISRLASVLSCRCPFYFASVHCWDLFALFIAKNLSRVGLGSHV
jgi:hypothetical protein